MKTKSKSGQILILVLLVIVVSLGVGLSVASRNLANLKTSTQAEQSQRAFSAAEGGVENTLSRLNQIAVPLRAYNVGAPAGCQQITSYNDGLGNPQPLFVDGEVVCTTPTTEQGVASQVKILAKRNYERLVETGDAAQINLDGRTAPTTFTIKWSKKNTEDLPYKATMEFTFVCTNDATTSCLTSTKAANTYGQHRVAYTIETIPGQGSGFLPCPSTADTVFNCAVQFTAVPANVKLLRVKPFWNRASVLLEGHTSDGRNLPVQTYELISTATTDTGVTRKVEVRRDALPQLPAIFDYVLYSGKDIVK